MTIDKCTPSIEFSTAASFRCRFSPYFMEVVDRPPTHSSSVADINPRTIAFRRTSTTRGRVNGEGAKSDLFADCSICTQS